MPRFFLLFLALVALFNLSRLVREPRPDADRPMDFRTCYVGQAVLRQGGNPYEDATLKAGWQRTVQAEKLPSRTQPGLPNLPFLYPPWAAALFGLSIGQLPYAVAWPLWYGLALLSLGLLAWLWAKVLPNPDGLSVPWWQFLLAAVALKGTVPALLTGQPTFAALALGVGALAVGQQAERRLSRQLLAGLLLGLAAYKVTLLLPFAVWFVWQKQWLPLLVAAGVVALLSAVAWSWAAFPHELLPAYQHLLAQVRAQSFDPADPDYPLTQGMTLRLELGNVLEWLQPSSWPWHLWLHAALWVSTLLRLVGLRQPGSRLAGWYIFMLASVLTLLTTYHLYYDAVLLLPLVAFGPRLRRRQQWLLLALLLPLLLPLNGLALALGNPVALRFVYFLMPVSLLGILLLLLAAPVRAAAAPSR
ncbi:glycosyltransferase family 87 protein [Hymenobacter daeguensis]